VRTDGVTARDSTVLVVGGGLGAVALARALRDGGHTGGIAVISDERRLPYDRPPLSKHLFSRQAPVDLCEQFALEPATVDWRLGLRATSLAHTPEGTVIAARDSSGRLHELTAATVVVATGARPVAPWDGARTLATWDDACALRAALRPGSRLVVVGAGWIGMELAGVAAAAGVQVTLVEASGRPLGGLVPAAVGDRLAGWLADAGIALVAQAVRAASAGEVTLDDGSRLEADVVVAATGARPATEWLPPGWLTATGHVLTDAAGAVGAAPGVWAIGDCAAADGVVDQHWNAAVAGAERCAAALLGAAAPAIRPPAIFSTMLGHAVDLIGRSRPDCEVLWRGDGGWTALLLDGDSLVGGLVVDRPRDVAALRRLLARGPQRVIREAAADPSRPLRDAVR